MIKRAAVFIMVLALAFTLSVPGFTAGFGDIAFNNGSFVYNGVNYENLYFKIWTNSQLKIPAKDVTEVKVIKDAFLGKVIIVRLKDWAIEVPLSKFRCIQIAGVNLLVDL